MNDSDRQAKDIKYPKNIDEAIYVLKDHLTRGQEYQHQVVQEILDKETITDSSLSIHWCGSDEKGKIIVETIIKSICEINENNVKDIKKFASMFK